MKTDDELMVEHLQEMLENSVRIINAMMDELGTDEFVMPIRQRVYYGPPRPVYVRRNPADLTEVVSRDRT